MLSDEKITHIAHVLLKGLIEKKSIALNADESAVRKDIKRVLNSEIRTAGDMDEAVRKKLQSFSKKIAEGSSEWEVLYRKFYREEEVKRGRALG